MGLLNIFVYVILLKIFSVFITVDENIHIAQDHAKTNSATIVSTNEATLQEIIFNLKKEE